MSRHYQVSANPVREALLQLQGEGMVDMRMHRGAVIPAVDERVKYNPQTHLTMLSQMTAVPVVMVVPANCKYLSITDVIAFAKTNSDAIKAASGGVGASSHLAMELLSRNQNFKFLRVPYKGGALANQASLSGDVDTMFYPMSGALKSMIEVGRMKPIALMQDTRVDSRPNLKTAKELGLSPATCI